MKTGKKRCLLWLLSGLLLLLVWSPAGYAEVLISGTVWSSNDTHLSGARIGLTGTPSLYTMSGDDGSFALGGLPSGVDFSLKISKAGYLPTYTSNMNFTDGSAVTSAGPFTLFKAAEVAGWGVAPGKGVIHGKVADKVNIMSYVGNATVTAASAAHPGTPYTVTYFDGKLFGGSTTYPNGEYYIFNVDDGDTVTVNAAKIAWLFTPRTFIAHADSVSQARVQGAGSATISGNVSYSGSQTGTVYVAVFADPVISQYSQPLYLTSLPSPGGYVISNISDGTYYVGAVMPHASPMLMTDPWGMFGMVNSSSKATPVTVSGGTPVSGVNITLFDGNAQQPNPFYVQGKVSVSIDCPVSVASGTPLSVTVHLTNWDCGAPVTVSRFIATLMGNSDGTLAGLGLFGPAKKTLATAKTVPPGVCGVSAGTVPPFALQIADAVPASLKGKTALVALTALSASGETFGDNSCFVNVQ